MSALYIYIYIYIYIYTRTYILVTPVMLPRLGATGEAQAHVGEPLQPLQVLEDKYYNVIYYNII